LRQAKSPAFEAAWQCDRWSAKEVVKGKRK